MCFKIIYLKNKVGGVKVRKTDKKREAAEHVKKMKISENERF